MLSGLPTEKARAEEAERIVNWAFRQFTMKTVIPKGETVAWAPVWLGAARRVALTAPEGVNVLIPAGAASGAGLLRTASISARAANSARVAASSGERHRPASA